MYYKFHFIDKEIGAKKGQPEIHWLQAAQTGWGFSNLHTISLSVKKKKKQTNEKNLTVL